ncbi:MAG TPA: hypothetical protein VE755_04940, partial [Myxococcales bacterium]|nr:hypothetical protein [Myxococcales bacterium]
MATSGNVVSISADGSLNRAQTWQDPDGRFHVVLPNGQAELSGPAHGVKVQHVGNSLELVIPVRRGASVTVEPRGDRLDLVVSGGSEGALNVENFPTDARAERVQAPKARGQREHTQQEQAAQEGARAAQQAAASKRRGPAEPTPAPAQSSQQRSSQQSSQQSPQQPSQSASQPQQSGQAASGVVNLAGGGAGPQEGLKDSGGAAPAAAQLNSGEGRSLWSFVLSLLALVGAALLGAVLFVALRRRAPEEEAAA